MFKLLCSAIARLLAGILMISVLLSVTAGTMDFPAGRLFMLVLFVPMLLAGVFLFIKDPELLQKRLSSGEKEDTQKWVVALSGIMFISSFVLAGLDFRFNWFQLPKQATYITAGVFLVGYALYFVVMKQNAYLSRTVEVQENQQVISTGVYSVVRHPMYSATVIMFLAMPLVLGSVIALVPMLFYPFIIAARIKNEEKVLEEGLPGYTEYKEKVKYRLIPFVW